MTNMLETYLFKLPENYPLMLVSFFVSKEEAKKKLKEQWSTRDKLHRSYRGRSKEQTQALSSETFGGLIALIDPAKLDSGFIAEIETPIATGMLYNQDQHSLYVSRNKWINTIRGGKITDTKGNSLFNDVHGLSSTIDGKLLVVSTGVDGLLMFDYNNFSHAEWIWLATENGYSYTPTGNERVIDRTKNYQLISTTTPQHTTHINSAINYKPGKILATLFHQGELIEIDMESGISRVIDDNMKGPHSIRTRKEGYLVSDTINNQVRLYGPDLRVEMLISGDYDWIIDTVETHDENYLIADSNNDRIVKVSSKGKELNSLEEGLEDKIMYGFLPITTRDALNIFGGRK